MDYHIDEYFQRSTEGSSRGAFHEVIALHEHSNISWDEALEKIPALPKGWYELARISSKDRIEFSYDHWLAMLPYHPKLEACLESFFRSLDDIGIFITQKKWDDPYEAEIVYSLSDNRGFYRGGIPASEPELEHLKKYFSKWILPPDYLAFLNLHDGFWKTIDSTGITKSLQMPVQYNYFQQVLTKEPGILTSSGDAVDPKTLIPFYESFGMPYYQCFWGEWYPDQEMGNVYYSSATKTISNIKSEDAASDTLAFATFSEWLAFYLERID